MKRNILIWIGISIILVLIIWGLIGAQEASELTNNCTFGLTDRLCWFWEKNVLGKVADIFKK